MLDAKRLVPATLYHRSSSALFAVVLWLVAFAAPIGAFRVVEWARDRFADDPDDVAVVAATIAAVLLCFVFVWLPFHYHTAQAHRIGAPVRVVAAWFWLPLITAVGVVLVDSLGFARELEDGGLTTVGTYGTDGGDVRRSGIDVRDVHVARNDGDRRGHRPPLEAVAHGVGADARGDGLPSHRPAPRARPRFPPPDVHDVSDTSCTCHSVALTSSQSASRVARSAVRRSIDRSAASASTRSNRVRNLSVARPQRQLGIDVEVAGDVDDGEQQVAELVARSRRRRRRRSPRRSSPASSAIFGEGARPRRASRTRPSPPCR